MLLRRFRSPASPERRPVRHLRRRVAQEGPGPRGPERGLRQRDHHQNLQTGLIKLKD